VTAPRRAASCAALLLGLAVALSGALVRAQVVVPTKDPQRPRIRYADSLLSLNVQCIVRGGTLNPAFKASYVNSRPIGFCCRTCPGVFAQDPEPYLRNQQIEVPCMVYTKRKARIDLSLRRRIGHDLFYFSTAQAMRVFDRDPLRYVKSLSDPVTDDRFKVTRSSPHETYRDRAYYFASEVTHAAFDANREKYRDRREVALTESTP
jgi:YHS domain-containing protein